MILRIEKGRSPMETGVFAAGELVENLAIRTVREENGVVVIEGIIKYRPGQEKTPVARGSSRARRVEHTDEEA